MKEKIQVTTFSIVFFLLSFTAWIKPADEISDSELRRLSTFPKLSAGHILSGEFMKEFEDYALDQFPFRDNFRTVKAVSYLYFMGQLDNNGIYVKDGYAAKLEYPYNAESVDYVCDKISNIYDKFLKDKNINIYFSVIPDKNYFLAEGKNVLKLDYNRLLEDMKQNLWYASYIDIFDKLEKSDYYATDTHWNQIYIADVASTIADGMETVIDTGFETVTVDKPFYGVYYGQAALPLSPDKMQFLNNSAIENAKVYDLQNNKEISVYDEAKLESRSPYDLFLGGSLSLITMENENAFTDKELIIFRDSFGSSIAPLFISGYKKITLVDIRYIQSDRIGSFIDFSNQDVLFLYSTLLLNNGSTLK